MKRRRLRSDAELLSNLVYMTGADVELLQTVASSGRVSGPHE